MKPKKKPATKKPNPQDATRRSIQAANKRIKHLETCYRFLDERLVLYRHTIDGLRKRIEKLENKPTRARR